MADRLAFEHQLAEGLDRLAGPRCPVDAIAIARMAAASTSGPRTMRSPSSAVGALGGVIVLALVAVTVTSMSTPTSAPASAPTADAAPDRSAIGAIVWDDGGVRLEARDVRVHANGRDFDPLDASVESDGWVFEADDGLMRGLIEGKWRDRGRVMLVRVELEADETDWWISRITTRDGRPTLGTVDGRSTVGYLTFDDLEGATRTPIGSPVEGDFTLDATGGRAGLVDDARISIDGARLIAFAVGPRSSPEPPRWMMEQARMKVTFESDSLFPGQSQRATAEICYQGQCRPAGNVRWRIRHPGSVRDIEETGASIILEAGDRAGEIEVRIDGRVSGPEGEQSHGSHGAATVTVLPRPEGPDEAQDGRDDPLSSPTASTRPST